MELAGMTEAQRRGLLFIQGFIDERGYSPSYKEIADGLGLKAKSGAFRIVAALCERGYLSTIPNRSRALYVKVRV